MDHKFNWLSTYPSPTTTHLIACIMNYVWDPRNSNIHTNRLLLIESRRPLLRFDDKGALLDLAGIPWSPVNGRVGEMELSWEDCNYMWYQGRVSFESRSRVMTKAVLEFSSGLYHFGVLHYF